MSETTTRWTAGLLVCLGLLALPATARADIFTFWMAGKGDTFGGSGEVFQNFDDRFGGGAELGVEVLGLDIFGEAIALGPDMDQFLFTANLGLDISVGKQVRLTVGAFTGPLFFLFPKEEVEGVDFSQLPDDARTAIEAEFGSVEDAEAEFDTFAEQEQDLGRVAIGWNLVRARADFDVRLVPGVYLGLTGQAGYHVMISGEDIAAGAKNEALDNFAKENNLPDEVKQAIGEALGARPIDRGNLNGFNYEAQLHLKFEFGT